MKLKIFPFLLCLFLVLVGCGDDEPPQPEPPQPQTPTNCKIAKMITQDYNLDFEYANGKLNKINFGQGAHEQFDYDTQGRLIKITMYGSDNQNYGYRVFTHESATAIKFKQFEQGQVGLYESISDGRLEFDAQGNLTKYQYSPSEYHRNEYDNNGNPTKTYYKESNKPEYLQLKYSFPDGKKNAFTEDFALKLYIVQGDMYLGLSKNNMRKIEEYRPDGTLQNSDWIAYQYNEAGYATKINEDGDERFVMQYNCQ